MMSMSGGWFFVVASEAISVSNQNIKLPGIGSYIALAIEQRDLHAIGWAIGAMLIAVLLYDQLFFRPLLAWADKFRFEESGSDTAQNSWLLAWLRRTERIQGGVLALGGLLERSFATFRLRYDGTSIRARPQALSATPQRIWDAIIAAVVFYALWTLIHFIHTEVGWSEVGRVFVLGLYTMFRVIVLIVLAAADLDSDRSPDWNESEACRASAGNHSIPGGIPGQFDVSCCRTVNRTFWTQSGYLAVTLDDPWHAVVHPVQCHCRGFHRADGTEICGTKSWTYRLAQVAALFATRDLSQLCYWGHYSLRRGMECQYRCRICDLGKYNGEGSWHWQLHRRDDRDR